MVHSVELLFDADTDAAVRRVWDDLAAAGIRSQAGHSSPTNRPHTTLTVAAHFDGFVDAALAPVLRRLPLRCRIGAPMLFGRGPFTLVRLLVPSPELLALHAEVHRRCLPHTPDGPLPHADVAGWTPHVTLARRVPATEVPTAAALIGTGGDIDGWAVALRHWDGNEKVEHPIS